MAAADTARTFERMVPMDPEQRLAALARAGGPLRRVMAALAVRWVDQKGWERLGYARLSDHARERLGLSARFVQELARVGRRLGGLPGLEAALVSGWLPWSKVRLLARFVTPEDEAGWIAYARRAGVRALERELRSVDRGALEAGALATDEEGRDREPVERLRIRGPAALCFKWQRTREYASRVAGERIPVGALLEMVTAEALSALPLEHAASLEDSPPEGASWSEAIEAPGAPVPALPADPPPPAEVPPFLQPLLEALGDVDAFELDDRLRRAMRLEQGLDAQIAPLLCVVTASGYEWRLRYHTLAAYARERLGMSPRKARALVRLERVGEVCPALRTALREGRLSWVRAQVLAPLLLLDVEGEWRQAWVDHATRVTVRRLEEHVDRALVLRETDRAGWERCRDHPGSLDESNVDGAAEWQTCAPLSVSEEGVRLTLTAPKDVARLFRAVLCSLRRALERETGQLPSEGQALEAMLDHALLSWGADDPRLLKRIRKKYRVFERDGWRCTVPGCSSRKNLHAHHIVFRSAGGSDAPENQTTLCAFHHQRGVHAGRVRVEGSAPGGLRYELGLRPGLPPLERYRSGDRLLRAS
jgi:hypothetical protein